MFFCILIFKPKTHSTGVWVRFFVKLQIDDKSLRLAKSHYDGNYNNLAPKLAIIYEHGFSLIWIGKWLKGTVNERKTALKEGKWFLTSVYFATWLYHTTSYRYPCLWFYFNPTLILIFTCPKLRNAKICFYFCCNTFSAFTVIFCRSPMLYGKHEMFFFVQNFCTNNCLE